MRVKSETCVNGHVVGVELDESDLASALSVESAAALSHLSMVEKHRKMMQLGDSLIVRHLHESGLLSTEQAQARYAEISRRGAST